MEVIKKENVVVDKEVKEEPVKEAKVKEAPSILKNTAGKSVPEADYFFGGKPLSSFEKVCGTAVTREDLVAVFDKVFDPKDNILFYKNLDKEVYIIIVPMKYSDVVGPDNDSIEGDFHKHAISFLNEGSVNLDTLKAKLTRIKTFVRFSDR
jgi:hypothetical protein